MLVTVAASAPYYLVTTFYPTDKFLERCEMGDYGEIKDRPNSLHISDIFDKFPVVLITKIFE